SAIRGNPTVSYCQTGSGAGKDILAGVTIAKSPGLGNDVYNVQYTCPSVANGNDTDHGFGATATGVGRSDLTTPSFAGADSPLNSTDVSNYQSVHGSTAYPVQFPAVAGAITIAMNMKTANGVVLSTANTNFSDAQLCSIFSGAVTNWNDPSLSSAFSLGSGDSIPSTAIAVQYRSDGSGTTFSFMNHLTAVCPAVSGNHFLANQTFTTAVSQFLSTLPSNWTGSSGNPAVTKAIASTAGSIGYAEMANSLAAGIQFSKVDGVDPATFGAKFQLPASSVVFNEVISTTSYGTQGQPVLSTLSGAPSNECLELVDPSQYANPSSGYPIMAISYLLGNAASNPTADLTNIRNLIGAPYNSTITGSSSLTQFGVGKGLALLDTSLTTVPSTGEVTSCVN
ncbi:MAG TPA: substrate-binding domain-containing protein, partial [Dyella sp.]|nr:substrate-binding domain-containing protein [Dyella sp.]